MWVASFLSKGKKMYIEMLKAVKYGFAMEHSKEGVRAATSYMTKQVEPVLEKLIRAKGKIEEVI